MSNKAPWWAILATAFPTSGRIKCGPSGCDIANLSSEMAVAYNRLNRSLKLVFVPFLRLSFVEVFVTRIVFHDLDAFSEAAGGMSGRFMPTSRSTEEWWVESAPAGPVLTQMLHVGGGATFFGEGKPNQIALQIPLAPPARVRLDGRPLESDSFLLITEGFPFTLSNVAPIRWTVVVVPSEHEMLESELMRSQMSRLLRKRSTLRTDTNRDHLNTIRLIAARLSAAADAISSDAVAARCAQEELIAAVARALESSSNPRPEQLGRPPFSRRRVISDVLGLLEASTGAPLSMAALCHATGVAERTMRNIFGEYFGVGPMRFQQIYQLREIRAALLAADPTETTVTRIAARFGVWDISLLAQNYKALFGELPSRTLRTSLRPAPPPLIASNSWLRYATRALSRASADDS